MKKFALLLAVALVTVFNSCKQEDTTPVKYPITGVWQPIKETWVNVGVNNVATTDLITYTTCELQDRWTFETDTKGIRTENSEDLTGNCQLDQTRNFSYFYDSSTTDFQMKYQGDILPYVGKVTLLTENTMNLKIEYTDAIGYHSNTYTFKRVQ